MTQFKIFDGWANAEVAPESPAPVFRVPYSARHLAAQTRVVTTFDDAEALIVDLSRLSVGAIAIDTEYQFAEGPTKLSNGKSWYDIRQLQPLILSGAAWVPEGNHIIRFLFDLRDKDLHPVVADLLRLHVPFVAHNIKAELQTFWAMGLDPVLPQTWCTYIAARALGMGRKDLRFSLDDQCSAYGIRHPFSASKQAMQQSFLTHEAGRPFTSEQREYAVADAETTLMLYLAQQEDVLKAGLNSHLAAVEFPFVQANSRMEWDGVPFDHTRAKDLQVGLAQALQHHRETLNGLGLDNPNSPSQVVSFLTARGHGHRLLKDGKPSSEDSVLERLEVLDQAAMHIRRYRQYRRLCSSPLILGEQISADGRVHPKHMQLSADTGRNTCSAPNVAGVSKTFRPLVRANEGRCIFEADFSQIEVGITAAHYEDKNLVESFNSGDVYAGVAKKMFEADLSDRELAMTTAAFKAARGDLRDKAKVFVLATTYGMSEQTIADKFGFTLMQARELKTSFFDAFPSLKAVADAAGTEGQIRGHASMIGGLRRSVPSNYKSRNRHMNTPVQGSAGVVFRRSVADIYAAFRGTSTQLILPVHDAVVVECDACDLDRVIQTTVTLMETAVRAYYPALTPRIDVNATDTSCWNKDGHGDSIEQFVSDPTFKL
jgi:DNA polymerase-1